MTFTYVRDHFWWAMTLFGTPLFYLFLIFMFFEMDRPFAFKFLTILIIVEVICWLIKIVYKKDRPTPQSRTSFIESIDANSFPSIHAARISAIAIALFFFYGGLLFFSIGICLMLGVAYSRIFLKKHDVLDVAAGVFIGALVSSFLFFY